MSAKKEPILSVLFLSFALVMVTCDGNAPGDNTDTFGSDTAPDTGEDTDDTLDTTPDSSPDTPPDTAPDTQPDTVFDTGPDTMPDTAEDTELDVPPTLAPVTFVIRNTSNQSLYVDSTTGLNSTLRASFDGTQDSVHFWPPSCVEDCASFEDECHGCLMCDYFPSIGHIAAGDEIQLNWDASAIHEIDQRCDCSCYQVVPTPIVSYRVRVCAFASYLCFMDDECLPNEDGIIFGAEPDDPVGCFEAVFTPSEEPSRVVIEISSDVCGDMQARENYGQCLQAEDEPSCRAAGGSWGPVGLVSEAVCQCPTGQENCPCSSGSDCLSSCIAPFAGDMFDCDGVVEGRCSPVSITVGCYCWLRDDGEVMGICAD